MLSGPANNLTFEFVLCWWRQCHRGNRLMFRYNSTSRAIPMLPPLPRLLAGRPPGHWDGSKRLIGWSPVPWCPLRSLEAPSPAWMGCSNRPSASNWASIQTQSMPRASQWGPCTTSEGWSVLSSSRHYNTTKPFAAWMNTSVQTIPQIVLQVYRGLGLSLVNWTLRGQNFSNIKGIKQWDAEAEESCTGEIVSTRYSKGRMDKKLS